MKNTDELFRDALHKLRAERAEHQEKQIVRIDFTPLPCHPFSFDIQDHRTAKRLQYGDYVRKSTRAGSLQTLVKPLPWSDFMHLKKGNLHSLSIEEKVRRSPTSLLDSLSLSPLIGIETTPRRIEVVRRTSTTSQSGHFSRA